MHKYSCKICNKEFEDKKNNRKYCSNKCVAEGNKVTEPIFFKICNTCNVEKSVSEYWKRKDAKTGCHFECIECGRKRNINRSPEFKEKEKLRTRRKKRLQLGLDPNFEGRYKKRSNKDKWRHTNGRGYWIIHRAEHPNATKDGRIFEHVWIMSEYLKRPLHKGETVHHLNGQRGDNRIENLELWSKSQPPGQRVEDKVEWCKEFLAIYGYKVEKI